MNSELLRATFGCLVSYSLFFFPNTPLAHADSGDVLDAAYRGLKIIARKTPETNVYLRYHKAHLEAFKAVLKKVDDSKRMGKALNDLEANFYSMSATTAGLIEASEELPSDPLKVMGKRILATKEDLAYVKKYNETAHALRKGLMEAGKTVKQMRFDFIRLEKNINAKKDFTRKFLQEELVLLELRMDSKYGRSFATKLRELDEAIDSELRDTWEKIEYSADILN